MTCPFWSVDHFVAELARVRDVLGLDDVHVVGHSWGAMLLAVYLSPGPSGVRTATLSRSCPDARQRARDQEVHLAAMSPDFRAVIERCEREGTSDTEEYEKAMIAYHQRHGRARSASRGLEQRCRPRTGPASYVRS